MNRRHALTASVLTATLAAACVGPVDVATERSDRIGSDELPPPSAAPAGDLVWSSCEQFDIPEPDLVGTNGWECATVTAAMDPFDDDADATVDLAVTRHRATGDRQGAVLLNPGGPGGTGLPFAWGIRSVFPADMLRSFDIVSWDPRGTGASTPAINCSEDGTGLDVDLDDDFLMERCAAATGELAAHLAAPYSAADMEAVRVALGEDRLDYLGYSYGAILGATYARLFPDAVGRFVLDGVTDPLSGSPDGYFEQGFPYYASDGIPAAAQRFEELCDATDRCLPGADTGATLDELEATVAELPTDDYAGEPAVVDGAVLSELLVSSFNYAGDWELLATGLNDAADGDASALASLVSTDQTIGSEALDEAPARFEYSNIVIYCADFRHVITDWTYCDDIPENERTLEAVSEVALATPILVIGTDFDPLTPGRHAPEFAAALGDAVAMSWSGVGHTAFPAPTDCINDAVVRFLLVGDLPNDGLNCPFLDEAGPAPSDEELGDILFGHGGIESERLLEGVFEFGIGLEPAASNCAARSVNRLDDQTISHVVLAVSSASADAAVVAARESC